MTLSRSQSDLIQGFAVIGALLLGGCLTRFLESDEQADNNNSQSNNNNNSIGAECGNGRIQAGETCDDGNHQAGDGCDESCLVETGWICQGEPSACEVACGNGVLNEGEDCEGDELGGATCLSLSFDDGVLGCDAATCAYDTSGCTTCGDEVCDDAYEDTCSCPEDCGSTCGDDCCNGAEDSATCPADCGSTCGDAYCDANTEDTCSCPADCGSTCGDNCCNGGEDTCSCVPDCGEQCGDNCCNGTEDTCSCVPDCGSACGDGCCNGTESSNSCPQDCLSCPGVEISGTCLYLAYSGDVSKDQATQLCLDLGTGFGLCTLSQICQPDVYDYLGTAGCECHAGPTHCDCAGNSNVYLHADGLTFSVWLRVGGIPGCSDMGSCEESGSQTCGATLCCK